MLGYGCINVSYANHFLYLKYELDAQKGFQFYWIVPPGSLAEAPRNVPQTASDITGALSALNAEWSVRASLVLSGLPASPQDAFYDVALELDPSAQQFSLTVKHGDPFAHSPQQSVSFRDLNLTFRQPFAAPDPQADGGSGLTAEGTVTAVIFGEAVNFKLVLNAESGLELQPMGAELPKIAIANWGELALTTFNLKPSQALAAQPQVHYLFGETLDDRPPENQGKMIYDCSSTSAADRPPINLTIFGNVKRQLGAVEIATTGSDSALIVSQPQTQSPSNPSPAAKLILAFQETSELTVVAWVKPFKEKQSGPARIVTLSKNESNRYFTLAQGKNAPGNTETSDYIMRLRSGQGDGDNNGTSGVLESDGLDVGKPNYVVYTLTLEPPTPLDPKKTPPHTARFFVNGFERKSKGIATSFPASNHPWKVNDPQMKLAFGNEVSAINSQGRFVGGSHDRPWQGTLYEVAIYNTAIAPDDIYQRYYPALHMEGQLTLTQMPDPLRGPLPATLNFETSSASTGANPEDLLHLMVDSSTARPVADQLTFTQVKLKWQASLAAGVPQWRLVSGNVESQLWDEAVSWVADPGEAGQFTLKAATPLTLRVFQRAELRLTSLGLAPVSTAGADGWQWRMTSATAMSEIELLRSRDGRPFDWAVDFKLLFDRSDQQSPLTLDAGKVVLRGQWLGQPLSLYGLRNHGVFILRGMRSFRLPFQTDLGPIVEPGTPHQWLEQMTIDSVLSGTLTLELSEGGFWARGVGTSPWTDPTGRVQTLTVPSFSLTRPPLTLNDVLDAALVALKEQAVGMVAAQLRHSQDYYGQGRDQLPLLYLGTDDQTVPQRQETQLPQLFSSRLAEPIAAGMFHLTDEGDHGCQLTLSLPGISADYRTNLKQDFADFLAQLDATGTLLPGALTLVKTRLAERLPLPIDDVLYYYYGLTTTAAEKTIDLQGGMRLRVDYQTYQFVHPALSSASSGFVGSGTSYYDLHDYNLGDRTILSFDGFLSQIQPFVTGQKGVASGLDTFQVGLQHPYLRLVYPGEISDSVNPDHTARLVCGPSLTALNQGSASFSFCGRATVIPEIAVVVNGQPTFISVGTTLGQLMARFGGLSTPGGKTTRWPRVSRLLHDGVAHQPSYRFVILPEDTTFGALPLVKGDRITFT
jgi:hypothetical protein